MGFAMADAFAKFEAAQPEEASEQKAFLDSIQSEADVEANRRILF